MNKNDKNIVIILAILFVGIVVWILSQYSHTKNEHEDSDDTSISDETSNDVVNDPDDTKTLPTTIIPMITPQSLNQKLSSDNDFVIIDIRTRGEFDVAHIRKSYHIDMIDPLTITQSVIFITSSGNEDLIMPHYRNFSGARSTENLAGGIAAWKAEGFSLISLQQNQTFANASKVRFIEPRELNEIMTQSPSEPPTIIDVRRSGNFTSEHIPSAINIPLDQLEYRYDELTTVRNVYIYGTDETQSFQAGALLHDLNFINTHTVKGGFAAWKEYGYPTASTE